MGRGRKVLEGMVNLANCFGGVYCGRSVLITGHTGFKGSWLSIWLRELGANVAGYGLEPYTSYDNFVLSGLKDRIIDIRGDIRDREHLNEVFQRYEPDFVFHLAAQPIVSLSYENPEETIHVNTMGTLNVLEAIRRMGKKAAAVLVTTDKCYENYEQIYGYRETDKLGGYDPYSASKACAEIIISSYRDSFMNPKDYVTHHKSISSVRAGNVIGGGDWSKDRLFPDCIGALIKGEPVKLRNPYSVRPWQYVLEPLYGYILLGQKMWEDGINYCGPWNFGPDFESIITARKLAEMIIKHWGSGSWEASGDVKMHETGFLSLDNTKSRYFLKWSPVLGMDEGVGMAVEWYKNCPDSVDYEFCINQIAEFDARIKANV